MNLRQLVSKNSVKIIFALIGGIGGLLYWKFVGCSSGTCMIKSKWYLMTLYGIIFGYLIGDILTGFLRKRKEKLNTED